MPFPIETLRAAENLFSTVLKLIQEEMKKEEPATPTILEVLGNTNPTHKKRVHPYGYRAVVPLEEVMRTGIWPHSFPGEWPSKGDTFYQYNKKTKQVEGFVWNSKGLFPRADLKRSFKTAEEALAAATKVKKPLSPAQRRALEKAWAVKRKKREEKNQ